MCFRGWSHIHREQKTASWLSRRRKLRFVLKFQDLLCILHPNLKVKKLPRLKCTVTPAGLEADLRARSDEPSSLTFEYARGSSDPRVGRLPL
jgi:hypothetical protein